MTRSHSRKRGRSGAPKIVDLMIIVLVIGLLVYVFVPGVGLDALKLGRANSDTLWGNARSERLLNQAPQTPLIDAVKKLKVGEPEQQPYSRDYFGQAWADVDRNGCDTRNDILKRDLDNVTFKPRTRDCVVMSGTMVEPYTGKQVTFQKGPHSDMVQIDHVVALANAWKSGAAQWDDATRQDFANDPLNLLAVDGPANQDKEAKAADEWLPPNEQFHCAYVARQVAVKTKWDLWVTQTEKNAIISVATQCPNEPLPQG